MGTPSETQGRERQRRRTARAIVEAAGALLTEGATPTIAQIADRAEVSRRTVHMHFPTLEQLLADAALGLLSDAELTGAMERAKDPADPEERIELLARAMTRHARSHQHVGRTIMRLTIEKSQPAGHEKPVRGGRRLELIETALAPARDRLSPERYERLVSGLAIVIGWESMLVAWDVRGLDARAAEDTVAWAAGALVRDALAPLGPASAKD